MIGKQRKTLIDIEREIKSLDIHDDNCDIGMLKGLLIRRKYIMNDMFNPTREAMRHFNRVNSLLTNLTACLQERVNEIKQTVVPQYPEFDQDMSFEAWIKFDIESTKSVIGLSDNGWYGSDFQYMIELMSDLDDMTSYYGCRIISFDGILHHGSTQSNHISNTEKSELLRLFESFKTDENQNEFKLQYPFLDKPEFQNMDISEAVHILCDHKMYSIPDVLRMNCFRSGIDISIENLKTQKKQNFKP